MIRGVCAAVITTAVWISIQILAMHIRPAENRFKTMLAGYLLSIPLVAAAYLLIPWPAVVAEQVAGEAAWLGWLHAYLCHLLCFFLYIECFYHVERSVTLRFLGELYQARDRPANLEDITSEKYSLQDMIERRLMLMKENGFIREDGGTFANTKKGNGYARVMAVSAWLFGSKSQKERM